MIQKERLEHLKYLKNKNNISEVPRLYTQFIK